MSPAVTSVRSGPIGGRAADSRRRRTRFHWPCNNWPRSCHVDVQPAAAGAPISTCATCSWRPTTRTSPRRRRPARPLVSSGGAPGRWPTTPCASTLEVADARPEGDAVSKPLRGPPRGPGPRFGRGPLRRQRATLSGAPSWPISRGVRRAAPTRRGAVRDMLGHRQTTSKKGGSRSHSRTAASRGAISTAGRRGHNYHHGQGGRTPGPAPSRLRGPRSSDRGLSHSTKAGPGPGQNPRAESGGGVHSDSKAWWRTRR